MKITFYILLLVAVCSCKQKTKEPEVKTAPSQVTEVSQETITDLNETNGAIVTTFQNEEVGAVYQEYLELKAALVNTNSGDAAAVAQKLNAMLMRMSDKNEGLKDLIAPLEKIALSIEVSEQRKLFEDVTAAVEKVIAGNVTSGEIIKQYCPMAFNGKGAYWLSDSKEIRNPYFGDKMLRCGVVDNEIK